MLNWFADPRQYVDAVNGLGSTVGAYEASIAQCEEVQGWCAWCNRATVFYLSNESVRILREGMQCAHCKLTNRQRLMGFTIADVVGGAEARVALLEQTTRLYRSIKRRYPNTIGSEFLGRDKRRGRAHVWRSSIFRVRYTRHEDVTQLSYASNSLDVIAHSDVLEHVYDYRAALRECCRVLIPGGALVFTVPFFHENATSVLRGKPNPDGSLVHFAPPEYHGDGVGGAGIYTFHSFGLDLFDEIRAAGFSEVAIGLCYAPARGFASTSGVFRAIK